MKLAIMQPYFFPYLGYFDLIHNVDLFVVYDTVQYIKHGWIHRNRILHPNKSDWQYINVPTDKSSFHSSFKTPILDITIFEAKPWREYLLGQLDHYRLHAPDTNKIINFVGDALSFKLPYISQLNVHLLEQVCILLNIGFHYLYASKLDIILDVNRSAEERILDLCHFLGATEYVNLQGGEALYDIESFNQNNIRLTFRKLPPLQYKTRDYMFIQNLSIIDVLMWNSPEKIKQYLDAHTASEE